MGFSLLLAVMADRVIKGATYKTFLIWPYAVAPVSWYSVVFYVQPQCRDTCLLSSEYGIRMEPSLNGNDAMILIVLAAAGSKYPIIFFFLAGLQSIPRSLIEAAALDGASPFKRFWDVVFPYYHQQHFF